MTEIKLGRTPHSVPRRSKAKTGALPIPHLNGSFPVFILGWTNVGKAVEGHRSPKPGGNEERPAEREASWSAPALWRFGTGQLPSECRRGNGARGASTRLDDDGNLMQADGNSIPVLILGWTMSGMREVQNARFSGQSGNDKLLLT
jgi:hypothetical protein